MRGPDDPRDGAEAARAARDGIQPVMVLMMQNQSW
jgi:hypothetical protein